MAGESGYTYTAKDNFKQNLGHLQGQSQQYVPETVVYEVREKLLDMKCDLITPDVVMTALSRLKYSKYYEYKFYIAERLGWVNPTKNLDSDYLAEEYDRYRKAIISSSQKRKQFPYSFMIYKIFEKHPGLSQKERETVLSLLLGRLPSIYQELVNPDLLDNYSTDIALIRSARIYKINESWDKVENILNNSCHSTQNP